MHTLFGGAKRAAAVREENERARRLREEERRLREERENEAQLEAKIKEKEETIKRENMVLVSEVTDALCLLLDPGCQTSIEKITKATRAVVSIGMWTEVQNLYKKHVKSDLETDLRVKLDPFPGLNPVIASLRTNGIIWVPKMRVSTAVPKATAVKKEIVPRSDDPALVNLLKNLSEVSLIPSQTGPTVSIMANGRILGTVTPTPFDAEEMRTISKQKKRTRTATDNAVNSVMGNLESMSTDLDNEIKLLGEETDLAIQALREKEVLLVKKAREAHNSKVASLNEIILQADDARVKLNKEIACLEAAVNCHNPAWQAAIHHLVERQLIPNTQTTLEPIDLIRTVAELTSENSILTQQMSLSPIPRGVSPVSIRTPDPVPPPPVAPVKRKIAKDRTEQPTVHWVRPESSSTKCSVAFSKDGLTIQPMVTSCTNRHVMLSTSIVTTLPTHYWEVTVSGSPGASMIGVTCDGLKICGSLGKQPGTWGVCLSPFAHHKSLPNCTAGLGDFQDGDRLGLHLHLYRGQFTTGKLYCHRMPSHPSKRSSVATLDVHPPVSIPNPSFRLVAIMTTPNVSLTMHPEAFPTPV